MRPSALARRSATLRRPYSERRVAVTGVGAVTPLGLTADVSWRNLVNGECGVRRLGDEYAKLPSRVAGLVPGSGAPSAGRSASTATAYALAAANEALADARWKPLDERDRERTGVAIGTGMIDFDDVRDSYAALARGYNKLSPHFIPRILPNAAAGAISIEYGFRGPNHTVSTACATGAHAVGDGFRFVKAGDADVMVCGGTEACVNPLSVAGFCRLRALSASFNDRPTEASRPFDRSRDGFVIGEGAAVLVLEELGHAERRGARPYAEILGYGLSGDAAHATAPRDDGSGAILSMSRALREANLTPSDVSFVNAHATSTPIGDAIESRAIARLFVDNERLIVTSTKGAHGHLLGAAGSLETLFTVMSCFQAVIPPTLNLIDASEAAPLHYAANVRHEWNVPRRRIAIKNSFGFGGTNASLCIAEMYGEERS